MTGSPPSADRVWSLRLTTLDPDETYALGERLGRLLGPGDLVCLEGDLGSGKTRLTQGIAAGLGVAGTVRSPTFILINEHPSLGRGPTLYHVDLYRLESPEEAAALGLEDYVHGDGVTVIEWAERIRGVLPAERLWVRLEHRGAMERGLVLEASGERYARLLAALAEEYRDG